MSSILYAQFEGVTQDKIIAVFPGPQDSEYWPNMEEIPDDDPRYLAFLNPTVDILVSQSSKLVGFNQLAAAQKDALSNRIGTLNDAVELEMAMPEEVAELPVRMAQLKLWKTYAVLLGRVTSQTGWPQEVQWPVQPAAGMDLTVSASEPSTV